MQRPIKFAVLGTLAGEGTLLIFGLITGVLAARLLLAEGRGALAAVLFWPQLLAGIGRLSLNEATVYRTGVRPGHASVIAAASIWGALILAVLTVLCGYILLPYLLGEGRAHLVPLAQIYLVVVTPFSLVGLNILANRQGELRFASYNLMRLFGPAIYLLGLLLLLVMGTASVGLVVAVNCAGTVLGTLVLAVLARHAIMTMPTWPEAKALLNRALRFHPTTVLFFIAEQADRLLVLVLWDDTALGHYVVALTIASSGLAVVSSAFHRVLFPHLARLREGASRAQLLGRGMRHATLLLAALFLPLAILMPWLLPLLFGSAFQDAVLPACALLIAYQFVGVKTILIWSLRGLGDTRVGFTTSAISLGLFLALGWPLASAFGLIGVATALGFANLGALAYLAGWLRQCYGVSPRDLWGYTPTTMRELLNACLALRSFTSTTSQSTR